VPNCEHPCGSGTPSFWFRMGKSDALHRESMACRETAHTRADRAVKRRSDVTSGSKTDANAGATAASGFGNPVPRLVDEVEVSAECFVKRSEGRGRFAASQ
jgi:hypothetical protein